MEPAESEEEPGFRVPPHVDDRLWRHPSELAMVRPPRPGVAPRTVWVVAALSAVGASLLTTSLLVATGTLAGVDRVPAAEPSSTQPISSQPAAVEPVVAAAQAARPAIVELQVRRSVDGTTGSGVLFRADGHLLTNAHVVAGAVSVKVKLADGRELAGTVVGSDPESDIAVVKIDGGPFPVARLGTAADLQVGQQAVAIGSPLALAGGPSVTAGVVSALHRTVRTRNDEPLYDMIQTDAPISPGSSGGALCDLQGRVVGITTAVAMSDRGTDGFGFATTVDLARTVADQLIATGSVRRVWLGIEGHDLDGTTARELGIAGGARVSKVREKSPAEAAGLTERDVILTVNGQPVRSMGTLVVLLRSHRPGQTISVEIARSGKRQTVEIALAERPPGVS